MHTSKQKKLPSNNIIIDESEFDDNVWQRAQIKNNSGYLDEEYEVTREFPQIDDYHFRVEDDQTILEFQKLSMQDNTNNQPINFPNSSQKFHTKLTTLLQTLNSIHITPTPQHSSVKTQSHGYYSLDKQYDNESSIKQAFSRLQTRQIEEKMKNLNINEKMMVKPKFIKKQKLATNSNNNSNNNFESNTNNNKMISQQSNQTPQTANAKIVKNLNKHFNQLSINEDDL